MVLDYDCVRDVLISLEDLCSFDSSSPSGFKELTVFDIESYLNSYTLNDIYYTVLKLNEANYIKTTSILKSGGIVDLLITDITFEGHQYLNSIRDPKIWKSIKSMTSSLTFSVILKAAEKIICSQIGL